MLIPLIILAAFILACFCAYRLGSSNAERRFLPTQQYLEAQNADLWCRLKLLERKVVCRVHEDDDENYWRQ